MFSHLTRCWETPKGSGSKSEVVEQQEGAGSLLELFNVVSKFFENLIKNCCYCCCAAFSPSFVCEFRFRFFFIALIIFILCGFRATCYGYDHGQEPEKPASQGAKSSSTEVLQSLFDFSQVIA